MAEYPYIKINYTIDIDAIENDVKTLKEILMRLSTGLNQEIILIIDNEIIRIDGNNKSSN